MSGTLARRRTLSAGLLAAFGSVVLVATPPQQSTGAPGQSQVFRSTAIVVAVDVRVVDRSGRPIIGLTKDDFTVTDNGAAQGIVHFWEHTLTAGAPQAKILRPGPRAETLSPPTYRVFLIDMDRPSPDRIRASYFDAIREFLLQHLVPQDYAAITAYGRVTDFMTDHAALAEVVSRIEVLTEKQRGPGGLSLLRRLWGPPAEMGSAAANQLEAVFAPASTGRQLALRNRAGFEEFFESAERRLRYFTRDLDRRSGAVESGIAQLTKVIGDIQMLQHLNGEKHLIWASGTGFQKDDAAAIAGIASHARVAVYGFQVHGLSLYSGSRLDTDYLLKDLAASTGGKSFPNSWPKDALAQIDALTRTSYLLGFIPSAKDEADGTKHHIVVRVKGQPDATVYARRQYFNGPAGAEADLSSILMKERVMSTAYYPGEAADIRVKATALAKEMLVSIDVSINASQLAFREDAGRYLGKLELAAFSTDGRERLIGEDWRTVTLTLEPDTLAKARRDGLMQKVELKVNGSPKFAKVVLYDYATMRAGSAIVKLR